MPAKYLISSPGIAERPYYHQTSSTHGHPNEHSELKLWTVSSVPAYRDFYDQKRQLEATQYNQQQLDDAKGEFFLTFDYPSSTIYDSANNVTTANKRRPMGILLPKVEEDFDQKMMTELRAVDWKIEATEDDYAYQTEITDWDITSDSGMSEPSSLSDVYLGRTPWEMIIAVPRADGAESPDGYKRYIGQSTSPTLPVEQKRNRTLEEYDWVRTKEGLRMMRRNGVVVQPADTRPPTPPQVVGKNNRAEKTVSFDAAADPQPEKYTEESWVVYHSVPFNVVQEYMGPTTATQATGTEWDYRSSSVTDGRSIRQLKPPPEEQYEEVATQTNQKDLPDYFHYEYEKPQKQRQLSDLHHRSQAASHRQAADSGRSSSRASSTTASSSNHPNKRHISQGYLKFPVDAVRQQVRVEEDDDEVRGLSKAFDGVGGAADFTESFNTVTENVLLDIENGVANIDVSIDYEHYTPFDLLIDLWKRNRVTVYRKIAIDFAASETTRKWFERIMQDNLPDLDWKESQFGTYHLRGRDAYKVYNALMSIAEEEEQKKEEGNSKRRLPEREAYYLDSTLPQHLAAGFDQHLQPDLYY